MTITSRPSGPLVRCSRRLLAATTGFLIVSASFVAHPAAASAKPDQRRLPPAPRAGGAQAGPDFWFGPPTGSVTIRGSWLKLREGGRYDLLQDEKKDLYTFLQGELTIAPGDLDGPGIDVQVAKTLSPRADVLFGVDFNRGTQVSEYRDYVDNNGLPILQETRLSHANITGSVRFALAPRGREISRLAWIPATAVPYVGAGGGFLWYRLEQFGEFVDFFDFSIFEADFRSDGWAPSAHVFGGVDVRMWKRLFLNLEARYLWANADVTGDYTGFEPVDLSGMKILAGVSVAF